MLLPARPNPLPGLALAAIPPVALGGFGLTFLSRLGGRVGLERLADAAGSYSVLLVGAGLAVTVALSVLLCLGLTRRRAPLVLMVGLATLPWFLGIAGTEEAVERVLAALPDVGSGDALAVLVGGTGGAMVTRLLGAWTSAALLVGVAVGLVPLRARATEDEVGGLLGAALGLTLGGIALLVALEAHHLFELLTTLAAQAPEARGRLLETGTAELARLQELRAAGLGALGVLALALIGWQFFLRPEAVGQWAGSVTLAALTAAVLLMDAYPMERAAEGAREAGLPRCLLPLPVLVQSTPMKALGP